MYLIEPLRKLCLDKLYKILFISWVSVRVVAAITDLIAYVYDNTAAEDEEGCAGVGIPLRCLILQFAVAHKAELIKIEDFVEFLGEGGDFVKDFVVEKVRPAIKEL